MRIIHASVKNLHGHITKEVNFWPDVNVLIGVNGSGKTSVLNAIAWTLSPDSLQRDTRAAQLLCALEFDEITVTFTSSQTTRQQNVTAVNTGDTVEITAQGLDSTLKLPVLRDTPAPRLRPVHSREESPDIVTQQMNQQRDNPVLKYLRDINGPLYLPLDRRWLDTEDLRYRRFRNRHPTTLDHLPIDEIMSYVEIAYRRERIATTRLNHELRNQIVASLFRPAKEEALLRQLKLLSMQELTDQRQRIEATLKRLGIDDADHQTKDFFDQLEFTVRELANVDLQSIAPDDAKYPTWVNWVVYGSHLAAQIERLIPLIEDYESRQLQVTSPSRSFLDSINAFLGDSNKHLAFSDPDVLAVELPTGQTTSATNLSSGELQLLTLFSFLYFRFAQSEEFTIIIDEPELSLHLAWQSRYLKSITSANPRAQFIVATHSPEIASPFEKRIIDISP